MDGITLFLGNVSVILVSYTTKKVSFTHVHCKELRSLSLLEDDCLLQ